ncbi:transposase [Methylomicrobium lacus]|uniref:transposase n=1 Tax=Methylomicrobium lacus TaxID=136992 RepID=UPI0035A87E4A
MLLSADRFYPSVELFAWLKRQGWDYRLRLKGYLEVDTGMSNEATTGELARGVKERYLSDVRLFAAGVSTNLGILHEEGHPEPWIIAMNSVPTRAAVLDYGTRWGIEPMFSDFKGRGCQLEDSPLEQPERLERLVLIMALAMYWCVGVGRDEATQQPTPLEKKSKRRPPPIPGASKSSNAAWCPGSSADYAV